MQVVSITLVDSKPYRNLFLCYYYYYYYYHCWMTSIEDVILPVWCDRDQQAHTAWRRWPCNTDAKPAKQHHNNNNNKKKHGFSA